MELTILGYKGAYPDQESGTTSYLLRSGDFSLLIDAGSHTFVTLQKYMDPLQLDAAIITHYHADHIADLGVLQYYRQLNGKETTQVLPIYGNDEDLCHFHDLTLAGVSKAKVYREGEVTKIGPFDVTYMRTVHPVPCFALRIVERHSGKIFVFTADSGYTDRWLDFAKDADLFLADTFFLSGNENNAFHFTAKETGEIGLAAHVKRIVATHLRSGIDEEQLKLEIEQASQFKIIVDIAHVGAHYHI